MNKLEEQIAAWRERTTQAMPGKDETVRELESHLRDHLATLLRAGVAPEAAFAQSVQRLGEAHALAREFRRIGAPWWPKSLALRAVLVLFAGAIGFVIAMMAPKVFSGNVALLLAVHVWLITAGYFCVFAVGLAGGCALLWTWRGQLTVARRCEVHALIFRLSGASCVLLPAAVGLGAVWARDHLGSAWSWSPVEIAAFCVSVSTGLMFLTQLSARGSDALRWSLAVLGGLTVVVGLGVGRSTTSAPPLLWVGIALLLGQAAVTVLQLSRTPTAAG